MAPEQIFLGYKYEDAAGGRWEVAGIDGFNHVAAKKLDVPDATVTTGMSLHLFARLMVREIK